MNPFGRNFFYASGASLTLAAAFAAALILWRVSPAQTAKPAHSAPLAVDPPLKLPPREYAASPTGRSPTTTGKGDRFGAAISRLVASSAAAAAGGSACDSGSLRPREGQIDCVSISGSVHDATGGPIVGALLSGRMAGAPGATALSDEQGLFVLWQPRGRFELTTTADGYSSDVRNIDAPYAGLVLALTPESSISGRVQAQGTGAPVTGIRVLATSTLEAAAAARGVDSDGAGAFTFRALPAGRYELVALGPEWRSEPLALHLTPGQALDSVQLIAARAVTLDAHVSVRGGRACEEGTLDVSGPAWSSQAIDAKGHALVPGLVPGRYEVVLSCTGAVPLHDTLEVERGSLVRHWQLEPGLALRGLVLSGSAEPMPGMRVDLLPIGEPSDRGNVSCLTNSSGAFSCAGLVAGEYECVAGEHATARVAVPTTSAAPLVLRMGPVATLHVTARSPDGSTPGSLIVLAARGSEGPVLSQSASDGFTFKHLKLGRYRVYAEQAPTAAREVMLSHDGELVEIALELPPLTTISGEVVDARGTPRPDAWVRATMSGSEFAAFSRTGAAVLSDAQGRFTIEGVLPRPHDLVATSEDGHGETRAVAPGAQHARVQVEAELPIGLPSEP